MGGMGSGDSCFWGGMGGRPASRGLGIESMGCMGDAPDTRGGVAAVGDEEYSWSSDEGDMGVGGMGGRGCTRRFCLGGTVGADGMYDMSMSRSVRVAAVVLHIAWRWCLKLHGQLLDLWLAFANAAYERSEAAHDSDGKLVDRYLNIVLEIHSPCSER